jgi:hypothetical protein
MVDDLGWWAIPIVTLVIFTLYGIEGIGSQLEDPFGYDRNDIKMDAICQDANIEMDVVLAEWRKSTAAAEMAAKANTTNTTPGTTTTTTMTTPNISIITKNDNGAEDQQQQQQQQPDQPPTTTSGTNTAAATPQLKYNPGDMFLRTRHSARGPGMRTQFADC